jgi:hypothetical protein
LRRADQDIRWSSSRLEDLQGMLESLDFFIIQGLACVLGSGGWFA